MSNTINKFILGPMVAFALFGSACVEQPKSASEVTPQDGMSAHERFLQEHTIALPDTAYSKELRIYKHVRALDHALMARAGRTPTTLTFARDADPRLADFKAGDVLVSSYDRGMFRTIEGVEVRGDQVIFQTRQAELEEAIAHGHILFSKLVRDQALVDGATLPGLPGSDELRQAQLGLNGSTQKDFDGLVTYNRDFKTELNGKLRDWGVPDGVSFTKVEVDVNIGAELEADYGIDLPSFKNLSAGFTARTNGTASLDTQIEVNTEAAKFDVEREQFLFSTNAADSPLVTLPSVAPLSLDIPLFPLTVNFNASAKLKTMFVLDNGQNDDNPFIASGGAKVQADLTAGLTGGIGSGRTWKVDGNITPTVTRTGPNFQGEKNFRAYAHLTTSASIEVGEGLSAAATITPLNAKVAMSQLINADTKYCPTELKVEASGKATMNPVSLKITAPSPFGFLGSKTFDLLKSTISKSLYDKTLVDYRQLLNIPEICDPNAEPPATATPPGQAAYGVKRAACEGEGSEQCGGGSFTCFDQSCVTDGALRISLSWVNSEADLDLIIQRPDESFIYWRERGDEMSGRYDFNSLDITGAYVAGRPKVENFFALMPEPGVYTVYVGRDRSLGLEATNFRVQAFQDGEQILNTGGKMATSQGARYTIEDLSGLPSFTIKVK